MTKDTMLAKQDLEEKGYTFDSEDELNKYLETEPYMTGDVWKDITIEDCNVVIGGPGK